jgi:imidazoleglycerol-phosphate dehydratase
VSKDAPGVRYAEVELETRGTTVRVVLDLDGAQQATAETGVKYFDHLLGIFAFHGCLDLGVSIDGGLHVDEHQTIEDVGMCLGQAIRQALGDGAGIDRFGTEHAPLDEALARVSIDISGRPYLAYDVEFSDERIGEMSTEAIEEFFRAVGNHASLTIHVKQVAGKNNHHIAESIFMAFGRALRKAVHRLEIRTKVRGA